MKRKLKLHSGLVIGGPLDGARVDADCPIYHCVERQDFQYSLHVAKSPDEMLKAKVDRFTYVYYRIGKVGFWIPQQIADYKVYQHKNWGDPYEYIAQKLASHYRPEGY